MLKRYKNYVLQAFSGNMGGGFFSPISLPSLLAWYKADAGVYVDAGVTLATNGQTVQQWNDQSGNNNHMLQATAGKRPTFNTGVQNGLPGLSMVSGSSQFMATATLSLGGTTASVFAVLKGSTPAANARGVLFEGNGEATDFNSTTSAIFLYYPTTTRIEALRNSVSLSNGTISNATFTQLGSIYDGVNNTVYIGGTAQTSAANSDTFAATGKFQFGAYDIGSGALDGTILELIITSNAISAANRTKINNYFLSRWAV